EPRGLSVAGDGTVWVADTQGNRIQSWISVVPAELPPMEEAPAIELASSGGLIESASGTEEGEVKYEHAGRLLTSSEVSDGTKASYSYNSAEQLTKILLPHGTSAEVSYDTTGRVSAVTTSIEGAEAQTTRFEYFTEPRKTVVHVPSVPAVTYEINEDGSV